MMIALVNAREHGALLQLLHEKLKQTTVNIAVELLGDTIVPEWKILHYCSLRVLLNLYQCSRQLQKLRQSTENIAVELLGDTIVPSWKILKNLGRRIEKTEIRVQRLVFLAESDSEFMDVEVFKEVLRIQIALERLRSTNSSVTIRAVVSELLKSISCRDCELQITDVLVQKLFDNIHLREEQLNLEIGRYLSDIAMVWRHNEVDFCCVTNVIVILLELVTPECEFLRFMKTLWKDSDRSMLG